MAALLATAWGGSWPSLLQALINAHAVLTNAVHGLTTNIVVALGAASAPSVANPFMTDSAVDTLISASQLGHALLMGAGLYSQCSGTWNSVDSTLVQIAGFMTTPAGFIYAFDPISHLWKSITWVMGMWIGDTTWTVRRGDVVMFDCNTAQYFSLPWVPVEDQFIRPIHASRIDMSGAPGVSGSFTTVDGKTITVSLGVITGIV
jgi:hypothetical protein